MSRGRKKKYIVIGLGRFGTSIAEKLMRNDCEVLALDRNEEHTRTLADVVTHAELGDAMDAEVMEKLGISNFDGVVIAIGKSMEASIMAAMLAKENGAKYIMAKAQSDIHASILKKIGVDTVVQPEKDMGARYAVKLVSGDFFDAMELSKDTSIREVDVYDEWVGKNLKQLNLRARYNVNVVGLKNGERLSIDIDPDKPLKQNEKLVLIGKNKKLEELEEKYRK